MPDPATYLSPKDLPVSLDAALRRLTGALDHLEAATERLRRAGAERRDLEDTLVVMQDDRGRLAHELDAALARSQLLERTTDDVAARLSTAGTALRRLLVSSGEGC